MENAIYPGLPVMDIPCNNLTEAEELRVDELLTRLTDKWSLWTLSVLARSQTPVRFSRLRQQVEGISQKSLTKTLRTLQADGIICRRVYAEVPPRVEYTITPLGVDLLLKVEPLWSWIAANVHRFTPAPTSS